MSARLIKTFSAILIIALSFSACSVKKFIPVNEKLLVKYSLKIENQPKKFDPANLRALFRPRPNKSFIGIRFNLLAYFRNERNPTKFNGWLNKNFGEPPVYYDSNVANQINVKMIKYLDNIGYFNSMVDHNVSIKRKKASLLYNVKLAEPYRISSFKFTIPDTVLQNFVMKNMSNTLINTGDIYNAYTFDDERDRITTDLRDVGFYYFNRNFIQFIIDSAFNTRTLSVETTINRVRIPNLTEPGVFIEKDHERFLINNVTVVPDLNQNTASEYDTVIHTIQRVRDGDSFDFTFLFNEKRRLKASAFNSALLIKPGVPFSATEVQNTYRRLFNFRVIRVATINFDTTNAGGWNAEHTHRYLNSRIQVQLAKMNSFQVEIEGTNSSGDLGIRGGVIFSNKNIFKQAEVLSLRLNGGFEAQTIYYSPEDGSGSTGIFNTFEIGASGSIYFPRFIFLLRLERFDLKYTPSTMLTFGFNFQQRPYYARNITNLAINYNWRQTKQIEHIVTPINFNYVNIFPTPVFDSIISAETNQQLKEQYSDHLTLGINYSFIFNNQNINTLSHFNYFRFNVETSGNLLYAINSLANTGKTEAGYYQVMGVRYSQYVRFSNDFRHFYFLNNRQSSLAFRFLFGIGIPYGNSNEIPYEMGFYGGGANDMRGWQFRALGPGEYNGSSDFGSVGDIQIEGNAEYRFPLYRWLKGAFFVDVGNIWTINETETFPGGQFKFNNFYQQFAVNTGVGMRLDLSFFIFRLDFAAPIVNPAYPLGQRNRLSYLQFRQFIGNFGIGYPF